MIIGDFLGSIPRFCLSKSSALIMELDSTVKMGDTGFIEHS